MVTYNITENYQFKFHKISVWFIRTETQSQTQFGLKSIAFSTYMLFKQIQRCRRRADIY